MAASLRGGPGPGPGPPPVTPGVLLVNMIPAALSGETNQDSEPFLAVNVPNNQLMAASAFTPDPGGSSTLAPIFVSQDGGNTWTLNVIVPSAGITHDITHAFDGSGSDFYAGILAAGGSLLLRQLTTGDVTSFASMTTQASRSNVDQPFVIASSNGPADRIFVGSNDFAATGGRTATIDVSSNSGTSYQQIRIEPRNTSGQDGPSVRPAAARDGTVYAAYLGWRSFTGTTASSDVVVVRDDNNPTGANAFGDLTDADGLAGRRLATNVTIPWSNSATLGQERIGSTLSIAVDPNNSNNVYIAWGDRTGSDIYTIHLRRSTDRGQNWSGDLRTISNATCIALAVSDNGTAAFLYQQVTGTGATSRWVTHLEQSRDAFANRQDTVLATVPANEPAFTFLPYIGDYNYVVAAGNTFRGIFSANNRPDNANFPQGIRYQRSANFSAGTLDDGSGGNVAISIDPFYFSVPVMP